VSLWANQRNYFENATACSKRTLKTTVATQLNYVFKSLNFWMSHSQCFLKVKQCVASLTYLWRHLQVVWSKGQGCGPLFVRRRNWEGRQRLCWDKRPTHLSDRRNNEDNFHSNPARRQLRKECRIFSYFR